MARDTKSIERDIETARNQLAGTLDEISFRTNPKRIADNAKHAVVGKLEEPKVRYTLIGAGVLFVIVLLVKIFR